jgi:hypothetical protein
MSEKADRYIGLVFWLLVVIWVWLIDQSDFWSYGEFTFDDRDTVAGKFFNYISAGLKYNFDWITFPVRNMIRALGYLGSFPIALWLSWKFRAIPMRMIVPPIRRLIRVFHKSV